MVGIAEKLRSWLPPSKTASRAAAQDWAAKTYGEIFDRRVAALTGAYDGARTTDQTQEYWRHADNLSPTSANAQNRRVVLRSRSRYECIESNSYARGMVLTKVGAVIGRGPKLISNNQRVESEFNAWAREIGLAEKLRTMTSAKIVDGEAFAERVTNLTLENPVKLDIRPTEADLWTNAWFDNLESPLEDDGILFDQSGNPVRYRRMKYHPGDQHWKMSALEFDDLSPRDVIHWFRVDRPDQKRGIPEFSAALPLFAEMRRWIMATIAAAETAAEFVAVVQSTASAFQETPATFDPYQTIPMNKRTMSVMPQGWEMHQFKPEHPTANFEQFEEKILMQIARCLQMPLNIAAGSSRRHNFASGRLDYLLWYGAMDVDQQHCECKVLDKIYRWWLEEARLLMPLPANIQHSWRFPERPAIDEVAAAKALKTKWDLGLVTDEAYFAAASIDPDEHYAQLTRQYEIRRGIDEQIPLPGVAMNESFQDADEAADESDEDGDETETDEEKEASGNAK